jgi:hypothetical protein
LSRNPTNGRPAGWIDESLVLRQVGRPVGQPGIGELPALHVRLADGPEKGLTTTPSQFPLDGFGDEAAAIPLQTIDLIQQLGGKGDRDARRDGHAWSMTNNMIILKAIGLRLAPETSRIFPIPLSGVRGGG